MESQDRGAGGKLFLSGTLYGLDSLRGNDQNGMSEEDRANVGCRP